MNLFGESSRNVKPPRAADLIDPHARTPRIAGLPALGIAPLSDHGQESLVSGIEFCLELGRVASGDALHVFLVSRHNFSTMFLDITDRDFDLIRAEVGLSKIDAPSAPAV